MKLPYIPHLRPSTLLGYLVSCAPAQLPSPYDVSTGSGSSGGSGARVTGAGVSAVSAGSATNPAGSTSATTGAVNTSSASAGNDFSCYIDMLTDVLLAQHVQKSALARPSTSSSSSTALYSANSVRSLYTENSDEWRQIENEVQSWGLTQQALDVFFQRISVAEGAQKQNMRMWYEAVLDIGSKSF